MNNPFKLDETQRGFPDRRSTMFRQGEVIHGIGCDINPAVFVFVVLTFAALALATIFFLGI